MINVANFWHLKFLIGAHNGQLPMAHNQLVRILNCWSRLKCRAPGSLLEVSGDKEETLRTSKCWVIIGTNVNQFVFNVVLPQAISFTQKDRCGKWKVIWCQWPARSRSEMKEISKNQDMHAQRKINCLRDSFIIPMWNLKCTRRRHTQSDPKAGLNFNSTVQIMMNYANLCLSVHRILNSANLC